MEDLDEFTLTRFKKGGFVVHRTPVAYSGISPDLNIEQTLMASIKGNQGITRGRGWTELNQLIWLSSRPTVCKLDQQLRKMAGIDVRSGQGSVKAMRATRLERDTKDLAILTTYFSSRFLFDRNVAPTTTSLKNISTGLVSPPNVSVQKAFDVGNRLLTTMIGQNPFTVTILKSALAVQMPKSSVLKSSVAKVEQMDPNLLFQRALSLASSPDVDTTLEDCLKYELSSLPLSLFEESGFMRSNNKAGLADHIIGYLEAEPINSGESAIPKSCKRLLDGGALLHKLLWNKNCTFQSILEMYKAYILKHFGLAGNIHVVFDGYRSSTKDHCHSKRSPFSGLQIDFVKDTVLQCKKDLFLSNSDNKQRFVYMLGAFLESCGCTVSFSRDDADVDIVEKGIQLAKEFDTVIVGDDTDLLIMMLDRFRDIMTSHDLYMFRPSSDTLLNIGQLLGVIPDKVLKCILLAHCASGCDTVSSISGIGKTRLVKQIEKTEYPLSMMELDVFYRPYLEPDDENLIKVGTKLLIALYDVNSKDTDMEAIRLR